MGCDLPQERNSTMENNVLQKTTIEGIATKFAFKNAELNKFSESIAKIAIDSVNRNIELAKILGRITESKCYKEDGFKSAADYANTTFGINKDFAYQLARVGNKFFNSDDDVANTVDLIIFFNNRYLDQYKWINDK